MAQTPRDDLSRRWLDKFNVDSGACRVFLGLRPDQQEALRRMGGLGQSHPSGVLMKRIRRSFGFVDLDTLMASDDLDQRSRSPALRIPNTKEGTSSLGGEQQGRREPQEGRHEQQGRREQQGRHEQQERREQQAGYLAEGEPGSKGGTSSIGGTSSKGGTSMNEIQGKGGDVISGPQPLHASTASLGAAEHTQTGVTTAAAYPSNPTVRGTDDFEHFKGSGKGSLGEPVAPPAEPVAPLQLSTGKKMSPQEIDAWVRANYKEMGNAWQGNVTELARGMNCLWKGIKQGKSGGESTKYEYFTGKFHGWADADFAIVS